MSQILTNFNRMKMQLATPGELAEQRRQVKINNEMARAHEVVPFGDSERMFVASDGGLGYTNK
ncbi:hypothetical protein DPMN_140053 [Dreissena polymorpha]|uniref:Uncharacterized protein n=1 Tax=Dreissena polymorpha TaxID=45954 RepID=A0A9D4JGA8_DREPO|nr:hypothetical protein DPMN_140053 [Dreissena polymorpha]